MNVFKISGPGVEPGPESEQKENPRFNGYYTHLAESCPGEGLIETERSLLGAVLSGELGIEALNDLCTDDFTTETHRRIFVAMERIHGKGEPVDLVIVNNELENSEAPNGSAWSMVLTNIIETMLPIVSGNVDFYINKLKEAARQREISETAYRLYEASNNGDAETTQELVERLTDVWNTDPSTGSRLKPVSAADLPDLPPLETLWGGIMYEGCITQLNAEPGAGKSTLLYNIAAYGALGKDFLGIPFQKPIKTLYADLETPERLRKEKIEAICGELPKNFYILSDLNLGRDLNDLIRLGKADKYDLIVFDTQSKVLSLEDENSNSEANKAASMLTKLTRETGAAVVLVHHTKKGDKGKHGVYWGRGASAVAASVDIVCSLEAPTDDTLNLRVEKSRVPGVFRNIGMRKLGDDRFERVSAEETGGGVELHKVQKFILGLLGQGGELRTAEIVERAEAEGIAKRTIERALKKLREVGKVKKIGQGIHILSELEPALFEAPEELE